MIILSIVLASLGCFVAGAMLGMYFQYRIEKKWATWRVMNGPFI